ncbi:MAG: hypothetical protein V4638_03875 [Bacteroidota bacterium]
MKKAFLIIGVVLTTIACQPKVTEVITDVKEEVKDTTPSAEVTAGGQLYTTNCAKCHKLFSPHEFTVEKWQKYVPPMADKAKLEPSDGDKILQYVLWAKENGTN